MSSRVLITGASGMLGRAVYAAFNAAGHNVKGTAFTRAEGDLVKIDLQDKKALDELLKEFRPEIVVHCAAERRPDVAEKDPEAARRLNVDLVETLSGLSRSPEHPFALLYISTDYVFDGQNPPSGGYTSKDPVNPTNEYAKTKEAGEQAVLAGLKAGGTGTVLRVPVLYGDVKFNAESAITILLDVVLDVSKGDKEVKMDAWALRRPTNVADVARVLVDIADKSLSTTLPPILSFSAQPHFTKYKICQLFAEIYPSATFLDISKLIPVTEGPKEGETIRPRDCWLSNAELEELGIDTSATDFVQWTKQWLMSKREQGV
ncbi:NAD-P-binding protein [Leucosporidium creatinivorum]|uniref:NAD-P-binding protein n=1 Tax=Leucosporidium creatinivorum TaxID=106004 RepID=A0A1Y2CQJ2_9BASI|nr:NAD-P-binding protein [Leucosporidium creatinivorum]